MHIPKKIGVGGLLMLPRLGKYYLKIVSCPFNHGNKLTDMFYLKDFDISTLKRIHIKIKKICMLTCYSD